MTLVAGERPRTTVSPLLGLTLRTFDRVGARVVGVADGSVGARAGVREGDVITAIGEHHAPTAAQISRAFAAAPANQSILVAISRGPSRHVLALQKE